MAERQWICCVALQDRNGMHCGYRVYTSAPDRRPMPVNQSELSIEHARRLVPRYCERHGIDQAGVFVGAVCSN